MLIHSNFPKIAQKTACQIDSKRSLGVGLYLSMSFLCKKYIKSLDKACLIIIIDSEMKIKLKEKVMFKLEKGLLQKLDAFCQEIGWSRSLVIREAIKEFIKDKKS